MPLSPHSSVPPTPSDLVAIVCAYTMERWDDITAAIASLQQQIPALAEIVLVVDHNAELFECATRAFSNDVIVVENTEKQGLSGARNSGIAASASPLIAFLDDDAAAIGSGWASALVAPYADPQVIGVGGTIDPLWLAGRPSWWPPEFDWVVGCTYKGHPTTATRIRNAIGANMSIRRDVFLAAGGFSSALGRVGTHPVGAEETELFLRATSAQTQHAGACVMFAPEARVLHRVPQARGTKTYFRARCYAEGLSKAVVARLARDHAPDKALSSETAYATRTLPLGVLRGVVEGIKGVVKGRKGDRSGFARAWMIIEGLACTTAGYLYGRIAKVSLSNTTPSSQKASQQDATAT